MAESKPVLEPVEFDPFAPQAPETPADAGRSQSLPLTSTQRELFAAVQMGPQAHCAFNLCYVLHLHGPLVMASMQHALQQVVDRHAALRMRLYADGSAQEVLPASAVALPQLDLHDRSVAQQEQALAELVDFETHTPFDLGMAGLWRARVLSLGPDRHALVFTVHHLASDGWSSSVLFGDLAAAYAANRYGMPAQLPPALPFESYVRQQLSPANLAEEAAAQAYWLGRHTPAAAPVNLPLDRARPPFKTFACGHVELPIDANLAGALRGLGARQGCTLFVTLLGAFQGLLARLSGNHDLVLGVPMANQTLLDNGHLVAHGANTLPLRGRVDVERPFAEWLPSVRKGFLDAQAHQQLTFGNLVHALKLPRDPSRTPLVDVLFNIDRLGAPFDFGELTLARIDTPKAFSNAELSVNVIDGGRELMVEAHYNAALFDEATVQGWLRSWRRALQRLVADPMLPLAQAFEPGGQELELLTGFNATRAAYDDHLRLEALFERRVQQTPQATALWCEGRSLSYAGLDAMANGVAYALQAEGVQVRERVGLFCARHEHMLAAVLGILKAGAAYVPLDPAFPTERLSFMAEDAGLRVVACDAETEAAWAFGAARLLRLERCVPQREAPAVTARATDAAYLIYTSGSTGKPKGVSVAHRSVVNLVTSMAQSPGLRAVDRMAAVATLSFDMSVLDLFLPLSVGACLALVPRQDVRDALRLRQTLQDSGATVMQAAPSLWRMLLATGWVAPAGFKAFVGGEPLAPDLAQALVSKVESVWNLYGPTEATVWATRWQVPAQPGGMRIGGPIDNTQIHVLDEQLRRLPLGATGEICIGGEGVALGYHDRPELTAQRFVADPDQPGQRLYRTGDLGRWHADGSLSCFGRMDHQVKLRGHRIELGEIEACLMEQPGMERAVVVLREDAPGDARLVAYVVMSNGSPDERLLRENLRRRLPEFMLPAHVMPLPTLPLLPNGKLDRQALPVPAEPGHRRPALAAQAFTEAEAKVAEIWRRALHLSQLLPTDNFFDLGGHSLLAARVSLEIEQALGFKVGVPRLVMETLDQIAQPPAAVAEPPGPPTAATGSWFKRLSEGLRRG